MVAGICAPAIVAEGLGAAGILAYLFCGLLIALIMPCFAETHVISYIDNGNALIYCGKINILQTC
jgi:hypothetical protein